MTRTATYSYGSKFSFLQRTFTIQLPTDGRATCRIGIKIEICRPERFFEGVGDFDVAYALHL